MAGFVVRQPNGLLCRFSTATDCPTHYNMTDDEYIEMCAERARKEARETINRYLQPFEMLEDNFIPHNMTAAKFKGILNEMSMPKEYARFTEVRK